MNVKRRLVQLITAALQLGLLVALFLPFMHDYDLSKSLWSMATEGMSTGSVSDILSGSLFYVPVVVSLLLVALLDSKIRYGIALLSSAMGFSLLLTQAVFPAFSMSYLFSVYQIGLYLTLTFEVLTIVSCCIGICEKPVDASAPKKVSPKRNTVEIPVIVLPETPKAEKVKK